MAVALGRHVVAPPLVPSLAPLTPDEVRRLGDGHVVVRDHLLGASLARRSAAALRTLDEDGALTPACVGRDRRHVPSVRGDRTAWFARCALPDALIPLWAAFEGIQHRLNQDAWLGLQRFEVQLACYPGGAHYARHTDTFAGDTSRRLTAIVYLNPGWVPGDGGELVAHTPDGPQRIEPVLDRVVVFLSDRVMHEVLPASRPRFAATAWFRGAEVVPLLPDLPGA